MKNRATKFISLALCAVVLFAAVGTSVFALTGEGKESEDENQETTINASAEVETSKDETVYVLAGADGTVQKIIVSDWIKNAMAAGSLEDKTELSNIENIKGDESFTLGGDNSCVWDAQGNDIYYQGNIEKELPVQMSVCYTLDGQAIAPEALAGQSGHVTIRFDYQNMQYEEVLLDGKTEKIYVPFAMLTGMLLDTEVFRNVTISNGKLINDGDRIAVVGIAFPGLQEDLAISKEKLDIPDYVEMHGTLRSLDPDCRKKMMAAIDRIVKGCAESMRGTAEVEWEIGVPPLVNDDSIIEAVAEAAAKTIGADHVSYVKNPSMGSEDFSVLFPKFGPGAQFRLGSGNNEEPNSRHGLHNSNNVFDEKCIRTGASVIIQYARDFLK